MNHIDEKRTEEDFSKISWPSIKQLRFLQASGIFNVIKMVRVYPPTTILHQLESNLGLGIELENIEVIASISGILFFKQNYSKLNPT